MLGSWVLVGSGGHVAHLFYQWCETQCESLGDNEVGGHSMLFPNPLVVRLESLLESLEEEEEEGEEEEEEEEEVLCV